MKTPTLKEMQSTRVWVPNAEKLKQLDLDMYMDVEDLLPVFLYKSDPTGPDGLYDLYLQFDMETGHYSVDLWGDYAVGTDLEKLELRLYECMLANCY